MDLDLHHMGQNFRDPCLLSVMRSGLSLADYLDVAYSAFEQFLSSFQTFYFVYQDIPCPLRNGILSSNQIQTIQTQAMDERGRKQPQRTLRTGDEEVVRCLHADHVNEALTSEFVV